MMISLVIPVHNEADVLEGNLNQLVDHMQSFSSSFEVVLVENGSSDSTFRIAENISQSDPRVRALSLPVKDLGGSLRKGILEANGKYLIWYPIDLSVNFDYIQKSLEEIKDHDIIVGSKEHPLSSVTRSSKRRYLSFVYNSIVNLLFGLGFSDTQCVKTLNAESVKPIAKKAKSSGIMWEVELLYLAKKANLRLKEVPVSVHDTRKGSKIRVMDMVTAFSNLFKLRLRV